MKITAFLLLAGCMHLSATSFSQKVTLTAKRTPLGEVLAAVQQQTELRLIYNDDYIVRAKPVTITAENMPLEQFLEQVLANQSLTFAVREKTIIIGKGKNATEIEAADPASAIPQERVITGKVTDESGIALEGVTVTVKGTPTAVTTGVDGSYQLPIPGNRNLIVFTIVGFEPVEHAIGNQTTVNIAMNASMSGLDEVVVVGYGTMQRSHLTGAAGSIKMDETLASRPVVDFGQSMYGKIAGVQVSNASGRPGESSRLQIRGVNSISAGTTPLIVIDGIPMPNFDLNTINSSDILSIDVLKDAASAAIYGSRGANGVILVTTKSGVVQKASVNIDYQSTLQQAIRRIAVMSAAEYAQASIDAAQIGWIRSGGDPNAPNTIAARRLRKYTWPEALENPEQLFDTDWQDVMLRSAPMHKADVSIVGGDERSQYYLSLGAIDQQGIVIGTDYNRYNIKANLDSRVTSWLKIGGMASLLYDNENVSNIHTLTANQYPPIYPVYGEGGLLGGPLTVPGFEAWNTILFRANNGHPYFRLGEINSNEGLRAMTNAYAEITLLPSLKFQSALRGFYQRSDGRFYDNVERQMGPGSTRPGLYRGTMARTQNITAENLVTYSQNWDGHQVDVVAGHEYNKRDYYLMSAERRNFDHDQTPYLSAGALISGANDEANESSLLSWLGRINYNYQGRYIASLAFRRDGSSRFGPGNKWGNFPAASAGWRISEEAFMRNSRTVNKLTLRASYGLTGNDNFPDYIWMSRMAQSRAAFGNTLAMTYFPSSIENQDLRWERTRQLNVGLDIGLLNNIIQLEADVYQSQSDGLLLDVPVPSTSGFTSVFSNIGELKNSGVELNINTRNLSKGDWKWTSQVTFSHNRGEITRMGPNNAPLIQTREQMAVINQVGQIPFSFFGYEYQGVYMNQAAVDAEQVNYPYKLHPGMGRYRDVNGDGELNSEDRTILGNAQPDFIWAVTNTVQYKRFDLSILFHGSVGGQVFDSNWHRSMYYHEGRNYLIDANNRWRSEAEPGNGHIHALSVDVAGTYEREASSYWILDATYTRLKDITFGYNLTSRHFERIGLSAARIYLNATNLFTIQETTTMDPENKAGGPTDVAAAGIQFSPYPTAKTLTFGINLKF